MKLEAKVALVTGGSRGIGRGICLVLAREGARVIVNYSRDAEAASATVDLLRAKGGDATAIRADVGEVEQCRELVRRSVETFGRVDILVSNAGIGQPHKIQDTPDDEWERVMNVNARATFVLARELMPAMIARQYGRIVTISSNIAVTGKGGASFATYGASKAALITLTKGIAHEGAPYITANAICPGPTQRQIASERGEPWPPPPSTAEVKWLGMPIPLNRRGTPEDIGEVVLFLVSDGASYITGQTIHVSGGLMMP